MKASDLMISLMDKELNILQMIVNIVSNFIKK